MDEPEVLYAVDETIATITLNAADRLNALSEPMLRGLADAAARVQDDPTVRAVVLTGAGRACGAGGDVKSMVAADTLGAAQAMLDRAVAHARQREQFGRPVGSFQAVKHLCAEMATLLEPARARLVRRPRAGRAARRGRRDAAALQGWGAA